MVPPSVVRGGLSCRPCSDTVLTVDPDWASALTGGGGPRLGADDSAILVLPRAVGAAPSAPLETVDRGPRPLPGV